MIRRSWRLIAAPRRLPRRRSPTSKPGTSWPRGSRAWRPAAGPWSSRSSYGSAASGWPRCARSGWTARGPGSRPLWPSATMLGGMMLGGMTPVSAQPRTTRLSDPRLRVLPLGKRIAGNGEAGAMNPVEKALRKVDATQQRFTPPAFVFGVVKKYGDDNGGVLVSNMAYSAFVSLFPLLLILVTVLGLIAAADPSFRESAVKNAVADQIPLLGQTLTSNVSTLQRSSTIGLIVGLLVLIYGVTGLAQAGLFTMEQVWNLPGPARPGYVQRLGRAVLFLCLLGGGVIVTTGLAWLSTYLQGRGLLFKLLLDVVTAAFGTGMFIGAF